MCCGETSMSRSIPPASSSAARAASSGSVRKTIALVAHELHPVVLRPLLELERPRAADAGRHHAIVLPVLRHVLGMGDRGVAPFRLAHVVEKHQRGVLELADQRVIIYHPRLGQARHLRPRRKGFLGIDPAIEVVLDVLGRQRGTAVELDVLPEMECPRQPVRRDLPALRQPGADLHLEVVEHEPVVQEQVGGDGGEPRGAPRVGVSAS